ncbi:MAG: guanylate kinase [Planctomycetota bacterium]|jgi:guanylate kinase
MTEDEAKKGRLVVISGPSGVGKSTICREVVKRMDDVSVSVSATTRPMAKNEVDGKDYHFVSRQQFQKLIDENKLLEYAEVFDNFYGTPKDKVDELLEQGKTVILEIDVQGGQQTKKTYPNADMIFILPPTEKDLVERMDSRGRDDKYSSGKRLDGADEEIAFGRRYYDKMVINDDLEQAIREVIQIIHSNTGEKE